ncbi:radical SAM protein [Candidatus Gracilibacteria bacterium]|nr:radical SAM protein [Candidatus Gracilibacteria bacterium]
MSTNYQKDYTQGVFVGMVCNAKCGFCNAQVSKIDDENTGLRKEEDYQTFYSFERIKNTVLERKNNGAGCIIYEGGDFSMHPEIFNILEFGNSLGLKQTFQTNGIRLNDLKFVKKLKEHKIEDMNFSLHAYEEELSDKIMGVPGAYKKTIQGMLNCKKEGINTIVNFVLVKDNVNQLEGFLLLMIKLGVNLLNITMYVPVDLFPEEFHDKYLANPNDVGVEISKILKLYNELQKISENKLKITMKFHNIGRCIFDKEYHNYDFQFDLDRRKPKGEKYNFDTGFYMKKDCENCIYFNDCTGFTSKYVIKYGEDFIKPILSK